MAVMERRCVKDEFSAKGGYLASDVVICFIYWVFMSCRHKGCLTEYVSERLFTRKTKISSTINYPCFL